MGLEAEGLDMGLDRGWEGKDVEVGNGCEEERRNDIEIWAHPFSSTRNCMTS